MFKFAEINVCRSLKMILAGLSIGLAGMQTSCMNSALTADKVNFAEDKRKNSMTEASENTETNQTKDIKFSASVDVAEEKLIVNYELINQSNTDIYVLDVLPIYDYETRKPRVDLNNSVLVWQEPDAVRLIRGLPPYPEEKDVTAFITPQAGKIAVRQSLARTIELSLPLVEANPYYSPLEREKYEPVKIKTLKLYVHIIRGNVEGFEALPVAFGKDIFHIRSKYLIAQVEKFYKEFSIKEVELLKYPGAFTRTVSK